jgi:hypothetical protein
LIGDYVKAWVSGDMGLLSKELTRSGGGFEFYAGEVGLSAVEGMTPLGNSKT